MPERVSHVAVLLEGGLGNQLFQYAAARSLTVEDPGATLVMLSYGNAWGARHPDLRDIAPIDVRYPNRLHRLRYPGVSSANDWRDRLSGRVAGALGALLGVTLVDQRDPFDPTMPAGDGQFVLHGFFQHPNWWTRGWEPTARLLLESAPANFAALRDDDRVGVKLRRSDYRAFGWELSDLYYEEAFERLQIRDASVVVTCEDESEIAAFEQRVLRRFGCELAPMATLTGNPNLDDFWNLAACSALVLANSSYCWWAAALATVADSGTRVVYPDPWLPNDWSEDRIPELGLNSWMSVSSGFSAGKSFE